MLGLLMRLISYLLQSNHSIVSSTSSCMTCTHRQRQHIRSQSIKPTLEEPNFSIFRHGYFTVSTIHMTHNNCSCHMCIYFIIYPIPSYWLVHRQPHDGLNNRQQTSYSITPQIGPWFHETTWSPKGSQHLFVFATSERSSMRNAHAGEEKNMNKNINTKHINFINHINTFN